MNKKSSLTILRWGVLVLVILGAMVALVYYQKNQPQPGVTLADQGQNHVSKKEIESFSYNSNPPTSGPHTAKVPPFGIYDQELHTGYQIHMLEHGAILIQYATDEQSTIDQLRQIARTLAQTNPRVTLAPNSSLDSAIVLTAWIHLLTLDQVDEQQITEFFSAYIDEGPEKVSSSVHQDLLPEDAPQPLEEFE